MTDTERTAFMDFITDKARSDFGPYTKYRTETGDFIYEIPKGNYISNSLTRNAQLIGFSCNSRFYGLAYGYRSVDIDFETAKEDFKDKLNKAYINKLSLYNSKNLIPIDDPPADYEEWLNKELEEYKTYDLEERAVESFFGIKTHVLLSGTYNDIDMSELTILYIAKGKTLIDDLVNRKIKEQGKRINLTILRGELLANRIAELEQDKEFMDTVSLFNKLEPDKMVTVRVTLNIDGAIIPDLKIKTADLRRGIRFNNINEFSFSSNDTALIKSSWINRDIEGKYRPIRLTTSNIISIKYNRTTLYERSI